MTTTKVSYHLITALQSHNPLIRQASITTLERYNVDTLIARKKEDGVKFTVWSAKHNVAQYPSKPSSKVYYESPFQGVIKDTSLNHTYDGHQREQKIQDENKLLKERVNTAKPRIDAGLNNTKQSTKLSGKV